MTEVFYMWKERLQHGQLVTPHSDPGRYEFAIDYEFDTPEQARAWKEDDLSIYEDDQSSVDEINSWVLVKVTFEEVVE